MKKFIKLHFNFIFFVLNIFVIALFLVLPYYLFEGRLFLGGDDTRFHYAYPKEIFSSLGWFSWNNIASLPYYIPNHYLIPFLSAWSVFDSILNSKIILFNFSFSLVFILGFLYFQKFIRELIGKEYMISFISALIYICSPITLVSFMFFLSPVWLVVLIPIVAYYYSAYLARGQTQDLIKIVAWSILFSFVYYSIPWIIGILIPLAFGVIVYLFFVKNPLRKVFKRTLVFCFFIISSQIFWIIPFIVSIVSGGSTGLGQKVASESLVESFRNTIFSTATDNIIFPLLTLYHRQVVFDFQWQIRNVFLNYWDFVLPIGVVTTIVLFIGMSRFNQTLKESNKKLFILLFASFIAVLYFSTINIGFLKDLFLLLGYIPGFGILRNFVDKFALSYIFIYATFLALCFLVVKKTYKFYYILFTLSVLAVLIYFIPIKEIIAAPLWKTQYVYTTVNLPKEYLSFIKKVKNTVPNDSNLFSLPQNITSYAIVAEDNGINAYIGTSPVKFFTGINDLPGEDAYPPILSADVQKSIVKRDYKKLLSLLTDMNSGHVIVTKNIPQEVKNGYLFDKNSIPFQDDQLLSSIIEKKIITSDKGNYELYKLKNSPKLFSSKSNISYKKINPVTYILSIKNLRENDRVVFHETYHPGWNLYITENKSPSLFNQLLLSFMHPVLEKSHKEVIPYGNEWSISKSEIENKFTQAQYKRNSDGSISLDLIVYFSPQNYFYLGILLTITFLLAGFLSLKKINKK